MLAELRGYPDVLAKEPAPGASRMWELPYMLISPHNAVGPTSALVEKLSLHRILCAFGRRGFCLKTFLTVDDAINKAPSTTPGSSSPQRAC